MKNNETPKPVRKETSSKKMETITSNKSNDEWASF